MRSGAPEGSRFFLWLWLPVALYIGFIFWVSSVHRPIPGIQRFPWLDKPFHLAEYLPLGVLLLRALYRSFTAYAHSPALVPWRMQVLSWLGGVVVGVLDEWYQSFVPLKISSGWDVLWDGTGAALGQWIYGLRVNLRAKRIEPTGKS